MFGIWSKNNPSVTFYVRHFLCFRHLFQATRLPAPVINKGSFLMD
jgi:hypothetical protein